LAGRASFDSRFIFHDILPELGSEIAKTWPEMRLKALYLHMANALAHDSWQTGDELDRLGLNRISHLSVSLDISLATSGSLALWLFGSLASSRVG
jgi:hypothetical protein